MYRRGFITALYTLHELACFIRKWSVYFAVFFHKSSCRSKIKNFFISVHNKIVQTDFMLSGPVKPGSIFEVADFKAFCRFVLKNISLYYVIFYINQSKNYQKNVTGQLWVGVLLRPSEPRYSKSPFFSIVMRFHCSLNSYPVLWYFDWVWKFFQKIILFYMPSPP